MKKITLAILLTAGMSSGAVLADDHTFSVGYAQSKVQDFKNIRGVNLQYRYEFDSPVSIVGSFTWMKGDESVSEYDEQDLISSQVDVDYYSLMAGPAYRVNDYVSFYALGGVAHTKASGSYRVDYDDGFTEGGSLDGKSTNFAWGAGIIVNPMTNLSITAGYEGTKANLDGNHSINGFNVGVGYRF
ncbi:putative virulence related protein PagC [Enterobacter sp. BIGb0383]|uniref:Ail/Lom family outer membrane beta-barrel protein n=1 Tax=unclassified Enterobacter TaxID=2608935 RepID=UPI000F4973D9|nr:MULTISPECIES: Ail/Lom family outer membrane beta-barrel protein [unclassified Enterobacter]ROP60257.1 putative virulence related protein PagC [Enterobacter sp. BIGb0383]ROS08276.1 putative virulence related protein PagC [Enterobacter sp. BIGb0359]